jgi:pimeloyl-ACP methyl ester carboxylesterase
MTTFEIDGYTIQYEIVGSGTPLALTPGGRLPARAMRPLAEQLADRYQVLLWDRRNTGASDMYIGGESESAVWADDLAALIAHLGWAPAFIGGASAGCRVSLLTAIRHPEVVRGLVLWSVSGGPFAAQHLGYEYHVPYIMAAERGGIEEVIQHRFRAGQLVRSPRDEERLRAMTSEHFLQTMKQWNRAFYYDRDVPVLGATKEQLRGIAVPTLIFSGGEDHHPREASDALHELLPQSELVECPWEGDEYIAIFSGRHPGNSARDLYPRLEPQIRSFLLRQEAAATATQA